MKNIYVLTIDSEEDNFDLYFTTLEKAKKFIEYNFKYDNVKALTNTYYEGKNNTYNINLWAVDQDNL